MSFDAMLERSPRVSLGFFPTPLEKLSRLSEQLQGPTLWIKRDDQTGLACGGNKTRKLEFLMADAIAQGCDTVITAGAAQSNHCRQTAGSCCKAGSSMPFVIGRRGSGSIDWELITGSAFRSNRALERARSQRRGINHPCK